jgi:hypothetical protein
MARRPKLEIRRVQAVVMNSSSRFFREEVNGLLLDGWRVVPGTYYHTRVLGLADERTPRHFVDEDGCTWRDHFFIAIERDEVVDPAAAQRLIEQAEGRQLSELGKEV